MIESRCGLLCTACTYQEPMHCTGCIQVEKPFWGDCPVKHCCEEKELTHCGQCRQFPCQLLEQFAFDKEQGDGGARIEQCRRWQTTLK